MLLKRRYDHIATAPSILCKTCIRHKPPKGGKYMKFRTMVAVLATAGGLCFAPAAPAIAASGQPASFTLRYAQSAVWIDEPIYGPLGATLRVTPTSTARKLGLIAAYGTWNNSLAIAGVRPYSKAVYDSLYEQLECHLVFAAYKSVYNLDAWRPKVSWATEIHSRCNPLPSSPPPSASPSPTPKAYRYYVYHTCANGACGLHARTGPGFTGYNITRVLYDGNPVDIVCQTTGEAVSGIDGSSSVVWDKLVQGDYVADFYVDTPGTNGAFSPPIPRC